MDMRKKFVAMVIMGVVGFGFVSAANAGTEVIRDYGRDQYNSYAPAPPPPPRPIYYAPRPPIGVVVYPRPFFYRPWFGFHRRVFVRRHF
jgi:hypothetical protein